MKEGQQIRPEWVPEAYKEDKPEVRGKGSVAKTELTAPLYSGKKTPSRGRVGNTRKKP